MKSNLLFNALLLMAACVLFGFQYSIEQDMKNFQIKVKDNATAIDAVQLVIKTAARFEDSAAVNSVFEAVPQSSYPSTLSWLNAVYVHISHETSYQLDAANREQIKTPDRFLLKDTKGDCDDYTVLWSAILSKAGIAHIIKIVKYDANAGYAHIYPQALLKDGNQVVAVTLDNVLAETRSEGVQCFGVEVDHVEAKVFNIRK